MNTITRGAAAIAVVAAAFSTFTACGDDVAARSTTTTNATQPANVQQKTYPSDGRESRPASPVPADGRENRHPRPEIEMATGEHKAPID